MKYGIQYQSEVLRIKTNENNQYVLTRDQSFPLWLIDKGQIVEEARKTKGDGSFYRPLNSFKKEETLSVVVKTEVVVKETAPLISESLNFSTCLSINSIMKEVKVSYKCR